MEGALGLAWVSCIILAKSSYDLIKMLDIAILMDAQHIHHIHSGGRLIQFVMGGVELLPLETAGALCIKETVESLWFLRVPLVALLQGTVHVASRRAYKECWLDWLLDFFYDLFN